jgi:ribosomal protein S18 acetylase RimI-like enzyme
MDFVVGTPSRYHKRVMVSPNAPTRIPKGSYFFVLHQRGEPIASGIAEYYNGYTIRVIEVRSEFRRKGLGNYIVSEIVKFLHPKGKEIRLYVDPSNKPAISLYTKLGFKKVKEGTAFGDKYIHS